MDDADTDDGLDGVADNISGVDERDWEVVAELDQEVVTKLDRACPVDGLDVVWHQSGFSPDGLF